MKRLHRHDLYCWSVFQEQHELDFNGFAWIRGAENVLIDPMPMSAHDLEELRRLGGASLIVVTNSFHLRATGELAAALGAKIAGPCAERGGFPFDCDRWIEDGEELLPGLVAIAQDGSKTPGELALVLDGTTLIAGDLVRGHRAGSLNLLPDAKLKDPAAARASVRALAKAHPRLEAVLVGDGWCYFGSGATELRRISG